MHLDRVSSPTESALQQRREAAQRGVEGIEVASSIPHYDTSSASNFGSKTSMAGSEVHGYYSSSLPPDELYESSDGRVSASPECLLHMCVRACVAVSRLTPSNSTTKSPHWMDTEFPSPEMSPPNALRPF